MTGGQGMCAICAVICHEGHEIYSDGQSSAYCDCFDHRKCQFDHSAGKDGQTIGKIEQDKILKDFATKFEVVQ